jgi:hypothetical protein
MNGAGQTDGILGGYSLEIYGDWAPDTEKLETTIQYLLK